MIYSPHANIYRYTNGTLIKLVATSQGFVAPEYNFDTDIGVYQPESITVTAQTQGDIAVGSWQYSSDGGETYKGIDSKTPGITVHGNYVVVLPDGELFGTSGVVIKVIANDNVHTDTLTLSREVDPLTIYIKNTTDIIQTNDKIALIASEEQLKQFSTAQTMVSKVAEMELTAENFRTNVTANYATKTYAETAAAAAEGDANSYTDSQLAYYPTTTSMNTAIDQSAQSVLITAARTYATQTDLVSATDGNYVLQAPHDYNNGITTFRAVVYRNSEDVTADFTDDRFEWYLKTESNPEQTYIGTGKALTVTNEVAGYGGSVILRFSSLYEDEPLLDNASNELITEDNNPIWVVGERAPLELETSIFAQNYISEKFASLEVANDRIEARVTEQYGVITGETDAKMSVMESRIQITAQGIESKVYKTLEGYSTTEQMNSAITQKADIIQTWVANGYTPQSDHSSLVQTVGGISTEVQRSAQGATIISRINQTADAVTIQAGKISLEGVVTANNNFKILNDGSMETIAGKIGNIIIGNNSIYSSGHSTVESTGDGFLLKSDGSLSVGNKDTYIRFYKKNNKWTTDLKIDQMTVATTGGIIIGDSTVATQKNIKAVSDAATTAKNTADNAAKTATNYLYFDDTTGLVVSQTGTQEGASNKPYNVQIKGDGIYLRNGQKDMAYLGGDRITFYKTNTGSRMMELLSDGLYFYRAGTSGTDAVAKYTANGLEVIAGKIGGFNAQGSELYSEAGTNRVTIRGGSSASTKAIEIKQGEKDPTFYVTYGGKLVANDATIGGVKVNGSSIYSGDHSSYNSTSAGTYVGQSGAFSVGDDKSYLRFYYDNTNKKWLLEITASSVKIDGRAAAVAEIVNANIATAKADAAKTATNYLYYSADDGLVVSGVGTKEGTEEKPYNVQVVGSGINFRQKNKLMGSINGEGFILYKPKATDPKKIMELTEDELVFYKTTGTEDRVMAKYTANGLEILGGKMSGFAITQTEITGTCITNNKTSTLVLRTGTRDTVKAIELSPTTDSTTFYVTYGGKLFTSSAEIGGINVTASAIYSGTHSTYNSSDTGFYLGQNGAFSVGDGSAYFRYYQDSKTSNWIMDINANTVKIGGETTETASQIEKRVSDAKAEAAQTATNYLYYDDTTGLVVSSTGTDSGSSLRPYNVQLTGTGIQFREGTKTLGHIGADGFALYKSGTTPKKIMELASDALTFYKTTGNTDVAVAQYTANGLEVLQGKIADFWIDGGTLQSTVDTYNVILRSGSKANTKAIEVMEGSNDHFYVQYNGMLFSDKASIGGINVDASKMYSGSHTTYNSRNDGFMLGSDGTFSIGNNDSYVRYYKNNNNKWILDIRSDSMVFGGKVPVTEDVFQEEITGLNTSIATAKDEAIQAASDEFNEWVTEQYAEDMTGITSNIATAKREAITASGNALNSWIEDQYNSDMSAKASVSDLDAVSGTATEAWDKADAAGDKADEAWDKADTAANNAIDAKKTATNYLCADSLGLHVSQNGTNYRSGANIEIDSNGLWIYSQDKLCATFDKNAITFYRKGGDISAEYGDSTTFYDKNGNALMNIDSSGIKCYDTDDNVVEIKKGAFKVATKNGTKKFTVLQADEDGVIIKNVSGYNMLSIDSEGSTATFGCTVTGTYLTITNDITTKNIVVTNGLNFYNGTSLTGSINKDGTIYTDGDLTVNGAVVIPNMWPESSPSYYLCLQSDGKTLAYTSTSGSSKRYKDVAREMTAEDAERFYSVHPVIASYKPGHLISGDPWEFVEMPMMIAEDIDDVYPGSAIRHKDGIIHDYSDHVVLSAHQQMLIDQNNRIKELEKEVAELKALVKELLNGKADKRFNNV